MKALTRRRFTLSAAGLLLARGAFAEAPRRFPLTLTDKEWREKLSPAQFRVLREHGTERAGTSPLNAEKRRGVFHCAGCDQALFDSKTKFDSGTGWPSFYAPIEGAVGTTTDRSFFMTRTEVHCSRCGGHLGHVFDDGPPPTGKRYCMNGVAMTFEPAET
ncbi:MAG: peptide-methionine (R)-S-oxide reductase MsrB [Acidobacteria bacterium]|nr:peptide-methionine (R)-S-oxide reductase MsrB [Acidobacteriota bacterium]